MAVTVDAARFEREFLSSLAGEDVGPIATPPKHPMETVEDLVASLLAAADTGDADGWAALCTDEALQSTYLVAAGTGRLMETSLMAVWDPEADPMPEMEVIGDPFVVGDAAAIAMRYSAPGEPAGTGEGFVVFVGDRTTDGLLAAGSANFVALDEPPADEALARELIETLVAAWNADDVDGVLATMSDDVVVWGDVLYPETMDSLPALREMLVGALSLDMEMTRPAVTSGPFAAVPVRFTDATSDARRDVIATLWIRDARIAMMAIAQGELSG
jgi:hypothetical protein